MLDGTIYTENKDYIKYFEVNTKDINCEDLFSFETEHEQKGIEIVKKFELKNILRQIFCGILNKKIKK